MGNCMKDEIEGIWIYHLILDFSYHLDLFKTHYLASISRNLVSLPKLDIYNFNFIFGHGCFNLYKNSKPDSFGIIVDGLYKLKLDDKFIESLLTMHYYIGIKYGIFNESFAYLWHRCLGHISKERMRFFRI